MTGALISPVLVQLILAGFAMGAVYALVALGYTLIWNAVGVVNFAQGELVMLGAFVAVGTLANVLHLPLALNLLGTLAVMAAFGVAVATFVYRPVRNRPQLAAIVATLGLSMLLQNVVVLIWGPEPLSFAGPLGTQTVDILGAKIYAQYLLILGSLLLLMLLQEAMFRFTSIGRAMRATAQDAEAARLMGIPTNRIVAIIFAYASMLAGLAGWLLSPLFYVSADMGGKVSLDAFAACILGGFGSIPGALIGGLLLGADRVVRLVLHIVRVHRRHRLRHPVRDAGHSARGHLRRAAAGAPVMRHSLWPAIAGIAAACVVLAVALPHLLGIYYLRVVDVTLINVIMALGLNLVLGFGGQISLAQAAFFGIGAYAFALLQGAGLPALLAAPMAVAITAGVGALLGWPVLRLRGHYLALATLAFGLIVSELMVNLDGLTGGSNGMMGIAGVGLAGDNASMLVVLLAVAGLSLAGSVALAQSPVGLRIRAFRDDVIASQAAGIDVRQLKIGLFVASATYGGVAGVCYCCLLGYVSPDVFAWQTTFSYLAMVVVGGLGSSMGGGHRGSTLHAGAGGPTLPARSLFRHHRSGGDRRHRAGAGWRRRPARPCALASVADHPDEGSRAPTGDRGMTPTLQVSGLTKRFGGLVALDDISLSVAAGSIHAVIGPNGSGKTTLFNIISGVYRPSAGSIEFLGRNVTACRRSASLISAWVERSRTRGCSAA